MVYRMGWLRRLVRAPAFHFVIAGLLLFTLDRWLQFQEAVAERDPANRPVVISKARVERLRRDFQRRHGVPPTDAEESALLGQEIDEELLYREALYRNLDVGDRSIQWWLVKKMRFVAEDPEKDEVELYQQAKELGLDDDDVVIRRILAQKMRLVAELAEGPVEPSPDEVEAYFAEHADDWIRPARVSIRHVFLSRDRRGDALDADAEALLADLADAGPDDASHLGDPFPLGRQHRARSEVQLAKLFGPEFAARAMQLEVGRWVGPVPSAYGAHLVYVDETMPSELSELESVENQVRRRLAAENRAAVLERELARMRDRYEVVVEKPETRGGAGAS